eukprot:evm.model.NODE_30175_length_15148_cov_20.226961.6
MDDTFGDMTPTLRDGVEDDYPAEEEYDYGNNGLGSTTMEGDDGFNMPVSGKADDRGNLLSSQNNLNVEENDNLAFGEPRVDPAGGNIDDPNADISFDRDSMRFTLSGNVAKWKDKHGPAKGSQDQIQVCGTKMSFTMNYFQSLLHRAYAATFSPSSGSSPSSSSRGKSTNTSSSSGSSDTIITAASSTASSTSFSPRNVDTSTSYGAFIFMSAATTPSTLYWIADNSTTTAAVAGISSSTSHRA